MTDSLQQHRIHHLLQHQTPSHPSVAAAAAVAVVVQVGVAVDVVILLLQ